MVILKEDMGTLIVCATRYAQQTGSDGENKKIIRLISEKYLNEQSYKTLSVCEDDEKFFSGWPSNTGKNTWKSWYNNVKKAKEDYVIRFVDANIAKGNLTSVYLNDGQFFRYLIDVKGYTDHLTNKDVDDCLEKYGVCSSLIVILNRVGAEKSKKLQHDYVKFCIKNKTHYWYYLNRNAFDQWVSDHYEDKEEVKDIDFSWLARYAILYSMGRMTYMPSLVVEDIVTPRLDKVTSEVLRYMYRDTEKQAEMDNYGSSIDKPLWLNWREVLEGEINKRKLMGKY